MELGEGNYVHPFVRADGSKVVVELVPGPGLERLVYMASRTPGASTFEPPTIRRNFPKNTAGYFPAAAFDHDFVFARQQDLFEITFISVTTTVTPIAHAGSATAIESAPALNGAGDVLVFLNRAGSAQLRQLERSASGGWGLLRTVFDLDPSADLDDEYTFALTPDALGLYYTARNGQIFYSSRARIYDAFPADGPNHVRVPTLESPGFRTYVRSITADGCEIFFSSDRDGGPLRAWTANRL